MFTVPYPPVRVYSFRVHFVGCKVPVFRGMPLFGDVRVGGGKVVETWEYDPVRAYVTFGALDAVSDACFPGVVVGAVPPETAA